MAAPAPGTAFTMYNEGGTALALPALGLTGRYSYYLAAAASRGTGHLLCATYMAAPPASPASGTTDWLVMALWAVGDSGPLIASCCPPSPLYSPSHKPPVLQKIGTRAGRRGRP